MLRIDEFVLERLDGVIVHLQLQLQGPIRHTPMAPVIHVRVRRVPGPESCIDLVVIRLSQRSRHDGMPAQRFDGRLVDRFKPREGHLTTPLYPPEERRAILYRSTPLDSNMSLLSNTAALEVPY
jgi:hypothetical protein